MPTNLVLRIIFTILLVLIFTATTTLNILFETGTSDIFLNTRVEIYEQFHTDALPSPWLRYWGIVLITVQCMLVVYSLTLLCRSGPEGIKYVEPPLLSPLFLGLYTLGHVLYLGWSFSLDRDILPLAFVLMLAAFVVFGVALGDCHRTLYKSRLALAEQKRRFDDILVRVLVQNGVAALLQWVLSRVVQTMSIMIAFTPNPPIDQETASIIALAINMVISLIFITTDVTVLAKYTRDSYLPYITIVIISFAITTNSTSRTPALLSTGGMTATAFSLVTKLALVLERTKICSRISKSLKKGKDKLGKREKRSDEKP